MNGSQFSSAGLGSGAKRLLILGSSERSDVAVVLGANDHVLEDHRIISNGPAAQTHLLHYCAFWTMTLGF